MDIKSKIRTIPHFPKQGIMFRDITTLLKEHDCFRFVIDHFAQRYTNKGINKIVGIESRGFIIGGALAYQMNVGFVPVRKPNKLPAEKDVVEYELEYGKDKLEIHKDAINRGDVVLVVDDLIATGGTARATVDLVEKQGGNVIECVFVIDLPDLGGVQKVGKPCYSLVAFEGH